MRIAVAVIYDRLLLDALFRNFERDANDAVGARGGGERSNLERVQRLPRVAIRDARQMLERRVGNLNPEMSQATLRVRECAAQQDQQVVLVQRLELEDLRAGHQRGVDEEKGVVGRGSDEA